MSAVPVPRPSRRLQAARVTGASLLGVLGVRIIADLYPGSFFGRPEQIISFANVYTVAIALASALVCAGLLAGRRWGFVAAPLLLAVNVGVFVPVIAYDVQLGGFLSLWNLALIGDSLFGLTSGGTRARRLGDRGETFTWLQQHGPAAQHLLLVSLMGGLAVFGFEIADARVPLLIALGFALATLVFVLPYVRALVRARRRYLALLAAWVLLAAVFLPATLGSVLVVVSVLQAALLAVIVGRGPVFADLLQSFFARPALLIVATFGLLAFAGSLALMFPAAAAGERAITFIDALFTAMSATCVTGLTVLDTPFDLSTFGHLVILVLVQLGGLGIMVLSTFAAVLLGGRLTLRSEAALEDVLDLASPQSAYALTRFIVVATLVIEAIGAVVLALAFWLGHGFSATAALWRGVFHAVSAFCNAGFALWSDSLLEFHRDVVVQTVHALLLTLGSLGFPVLLALWQRARGSERRLSVHTRVVVAMTIGLLVSGAVVFVIAEWDASLRGLSIPDKILNGLFQTLSARTAGFHTVELSGLERSTLVMILVWMFIGGAPGGTGGGIKITTLAVVLAAIPALIRGQARAQLFGRTIPHDIVYRAATIITLATIFAVVVTFALLASHDMSLEKAVFEAVSALATVGLSIGATSELNALGKYIIIMTMFIGRVGPVSLALALGTPRGGHVTYPAARIMVG